MKKKVLVWETLATVSGGQKMTLTVMDSLRETYDFCCLIPSEGKLSHELKGRGIPYIVIGDQSLPTGIKSKWVIFRYAAMSARCILRSLSAIRKYKPDMLYAPGPAALPWSAICGSLTGKSVVWHLHHVFLDGMTGKLLNLCSKWRSVKKIICVSQAVADQIKDADAHKKTAVLYNPIDVDRFRSGDATRVIGELSEKLGRDIDLDSTAVLGHIALIQRPKKQDLTLRVIADLKKRGIDAVGLFCGEVRDEEYYAELLELAKDQGIADDVLFLGWRGDVPHIMKCMSVNMVPSTEGFSLVAQESAAAGVPSVAVDDAGVGEFMRLSGSGMLFKPDDADDASEKVRTVMANKAVLGKQGAEYSENWRIEKYRLGIEKIFDSAE